MEELYKEACKKVEDIKAKIAASNDEIEIAGLNLELMGAESTMKMAADTIEFCKANNIA